MTTPVNGDDLLARIKPVRRRVRVQVCLRPDLIQEHERLCEELAAKAPVNSGRLNPGGDPTSGAGPAAKKIAKQIVELEETIDQVSPWFEFEALQEADFRALCSEHPPRKSNQMDTMVGYDRDAVSDELIRRSLVDPVFSDEGWVSFMQACGPSEWAALREGAFEANGGSPTPPKSLAASQALSRKGNASA